MRTKVVIGVLAIFTLITIGLLLLTSKHETEIAVQDQPLEASSFEKTTQAEMPYVPPLTIKVKKAHEERVVLPTIESFTPFPDGLKPFVPDIVHFNASRRQVGAMRPQYGDLTTKVIPLS